MLKRLVLVLAILSGMASLAFAQHITQYGVQIEVDLPVDPSVVGFVTDPLGYATTHLDALTLRAFVELDRFGLRVDLASATEIRLGGYYTLSLQPTPFGTLQSYVGVYTGYNWRDLGWFMRLRGHVLLFGGG